MANTLTNLTPVLFNALDVVSRELVGFIPAISLDAQVARAAVGQQVLSFVAPPSNPVNLTPGVTAPNDGDQNIGNVALTIQKSMGVPVRWNGEEQRGMDSGPGYEKILTNQFAQAMRALCNQIENDVSVAAYKGASRAIGSAGSTPFGTVGDFSDASNVLKILKDNGAPVSDAHLVIDTTAGAKLLGLQSRYDVAGDTTMQNQGVLINKAGFAIRESAQIVTPASGTVTATVDASGYAVGSTSLTLSAAAVALSAGDVITFAGDTNQYVVAADLSGTGGVLQIAAPGLRKAMSAATKAITVVAASTRNIAFARSAIVLATRAPAVPKEGDMADDAMLITDPRSGLSFEVRLYKQYRQIRYEIAAAWGVKAVKSEHIAALLG